MKKIKMLLLATTLIFVLTFSMQTDFEHYSDPEYGEFDDLHGDG